jgi:hypothetical protein
MTGTFIPSGRNQMVENHYQKLGFEFQGERDGAKIWRLDLRNYNGWRPPIALRRARELIDS